MNTQELLLDALDERGKTYNKKLKRCRDDFSTDAVHDLQVFLETLAEFAEKDEWYDPQPVRTF